MVTIEVTPKGFFLTLLVLVLLAAVIVLAYRDFGPTPCLEEMKEAYNGGINDGLTQIIREVETNGVAVIGMPNNQSYAVTNPSYCQALLQAAAQQQAQS